MRELSALPTEGETSYATAYFFEVVSLTAHFIFQIYIRPLCRWHFWLSAEIPETWQLLNHFSLAPSCEGAVGSADWGRDFLRYGIFFDVFPLTARISFEFTSVRSAGGSFVDWYKSTQKIAFSYAAFGERILICGGKSKYHPPMRLKLGGGIPTFKSEKIRLNSKLSVKIVRKQVYERTESSFACCGFFGYIIFCCRLSERFIYLSSASWLWIFLSQKRRANIYNIKVFNI